MTPAEADKLLSDNFAPWVLELGLTVEELDDRRAVLRLPWSARLAREGGHVGASADGGRRHGDRHRRVGGARRFRSDDDGAAVHQLPAPVTDADVLVEAVLGKLGRRMAFADITMTAEGSTEFAARASTVYALLG